MERLNQRCISAVTGVKDLRAPSTQRCGGISKRIGARVNHKGAVGGACAQETAACCDRDFIGTRNPKEGSVCALSGIFSGQRRGVNLSLEASKIS